MKFNCKNAIVEIEASSMRTSRVFMSGNVNSDRFCTVTEDPAVPELYHVSKHNWDGSESYQGFISTKNPAVKVSMK